MAELFKRKYSIELQEPSGIKKTITELNISFSCEKTNDSNANKMELSIINLSKATRDFIDKAGITVTLNAGYVNRDVFGIIFKGKIEKDGVTHEKQDTDWISKISVKDGIQALRSTVLSKSFAPGTSKSEVINSIVDSMGLTKGTIKDLPTTIFKSGKTLFGSGKQALDTITKSEGLDWFVNDEVIHIVKSNTSTNEQVIKLSADSGLIGTPEKTEKGFKFRSLLRPGINPGTLIYINSIITKGYYVARTVTHSGEYDGQTWQTEIESIRK